MKSRVEIEERIETLRQMLKERGLDGSTTLPVHINTEIAALRWVLNES